VFVVPEVGLPGVAEVGLPGVAEVGLLAVPGTLPGRLTVL